MTEVAPLQKLYNFVMSPGFPVLIKAYQDESARQSGTYGTAFSHGQKPKFIDDRGVLKPERFVTCMTELQREVMAAYRSGEALHVTLNIRFLQSTLDQMYASTDFGTRKQPGTDFLIKDLFAEGKAIADILRDDFNAVYVQGADRGRAKDTKQ